VKAYWFATLIRRRNRGSYTCKRARNGREWGVITLISSRSRLLVNFEIG
jgi:hypothetical protein